MAVQRHVELINGESHGVQSSPLLRRSNHKKMVTSVVRDRRTASAAPIATSVPAPMATPRSADARAAASLTLSSTAATRRPSLERGYQGRLVLG